MLVLKKDRVYQGNLILVNQTYAVHKQLQQRELCPVFESQPKILMECESARMLKKLLAELKEEESGSFVVGVSGYRPREEQVKIFEDSLAEHGRAFTEKYVATPDHSEHQTGLAIDLALDGPEIDFICPEFPYEGICQRFREKMASFGFVERYPAEKQHITGIGAEPWHFRYVGVPHAELMQEQGMVLEEYIEWIKQFDLRKNPCILPMQDKEVRIGYVKAQGDYTRIEGLETAMERTRIGYIKLREKSRISWQACGLGRGGTFHTSGVYKSGVVRTSLQISGDNAEGFILTYMMGENLFGDRGVGAGYETEKKLCSN